MKLIIGLVLLVTWCGVAALAANAPVAFHTSTFSTNSLTQPALVATSGVSDPNFAPYSAFDPFDFNAFNLTSTRCDVPSTEVLNAFKNSLQKVLTSFSASEKADSFIVSSLLGGNGKASTLRKYAEDYGHIVHNTPLVVVVPSTSALIAKLVKAVKSVPCNKQFAPVKIVIRGAGGNVEGGAQVVDVATLISKQELSEDDDTIPPLQILLDMSSRLNSVSSQATIVGTQKSLWASSGATWLAFSRAASTLGLRPYVVPDYLGITLGGSLSIGGVGGDSSFRGLCAHHVSELEVVNSEGVVQTVTPNSDVFKSVLGGLGQFGIITRVRINLEPNHPFTRIYHYVSTDINLLLRAVDKLQLVNQGNAHVDTVQTFVVPNTLDFIRNWVLNGRTTYRSPEEEAQVNALVATPVTYIYLLEMTKRFDSTAESLEQIAALCDETFALSVVDDMPTNIWDERLYYFSLPALIQTGAWTQRHPWMNIYLSGDVFERDETGKSDFDRVIDRFTPLKSTGFGHIGLYPMLTSNFASASLPFLSVPTTSKWSYLLVIGRDDAFGTDAGLNYQAYDNRKIWDDMTRSVFQFDRPRATLYASNYIPDFGNSDWKKYFGKCAYNQFVSSKRKLDPSNIFMDNRNLF